MPLKLIPPRPGNPNWQIRGSYLHVKRLYRSTGTPEKRVAEQALRTLKRDIESGAFAAEAGPTFASAAMSYLQAGGEATFLGPLNEYFQNTPLDKIDQAAIDEAAAALHPDGSPATKNRTVYTPVSAILKHAGREKPLKRPKGARGVSRLVWLKPEDAFAMLDAARARAAKVEQRMEDGPRQFRGAAQTGARAARRFTALCVFLLYTGCRLSEALRVRPQDVELQNSFAFVGKTKNGLPRPVHLPPQVVAELANIEFGRTRVFGVAAKCGRLYDWLDEIATAAKVTIPPGVAFHIFRHTYGAWMRRYAGLDTSGLVGTGAWKSRQAAEVYEHVEASEEAQKADLLPTPKRVQDV